MITIGIDPHKATHTAAAVSELGRQLGEITVTADERGQRELLAWAHGLGSEIRFALEDCRHVNGRLERFLLASGEPVLRVGPRLMAGARKGARTRGKSDRSTPWRSPARHCARKPISIRRVTTRRRGS